jgi:hypothetical protein
MLNAAAASAAWGYMAEKVERMGDMDVPKFWTCLELFARRPFKEFRTRGLWARSDLFVSRRPRARIFYMIVTHHLGKYRHKKTRRFAFLISVGIEDIDKLPVRRVWFRVQVEPGKIRKVFLNSFMRNYEPAK